MCAVLSQKLLHTIYDIHVVTIMFRFVVINISNIFNIVIYQNSSLDFKTIHDARVHDINSFVFIFHHG